MRLERLKDLTVKRKFMAR